MKKIVLAYSGGLDTSIILRWLQENYKAEVIAYTSDIGQEIDRKKIIRNAKRLGVKKIIIEEFIPGREIQAALIGFKKLGAIELKPKRKFYDYQAKYNPKAKTQHIIPVDLPKKKYEQIMKISSKAHSLIGCRGVTRSDFKYYRGKFYLLEINTQPGMTKLSLVPEIAAFRGISFIKLIELILKDASTNK